MSKFNFYKYDRNCVMHCPTEESAEIFLSFLSSLGKGWRTGDSYDNCSHWQMYKEETCYRFVAGEYGDLAYFTEYNYTILEFYDFEWDELAEPEITMTFDEMFYGSQVENQTTI